jgi:hypothetical protein
VKNEKLKVKSGALIKVGLTCAMALAVFACGKRESDKIYREGQSPVTKIERTDHEMNAAIQKAKDTFQGSISNFRRRR